MDGGNSINYVTGATYGGPGSGLTSFVSGASGSFAGITYNNRLQPINMSASSPSAMVFSIGYDFHIGNGDNGNVFGITNYRDTSRNQAFTYNALNRLTSAQNAGTDCTRTTVNGKTEYWGNSYGYDAWGNLLQKTITKCGAENLSAAALTNNQLVGYSYDAAGNMTHDATTGLNYSFDSENRITGAAGYSYTYDADGNRVEKSNGTTGTIYWYMSPGIVAESDLSGNLKSEYVFFGGRRTARRDFPSNAVFYYFSDHLKTADVITDSAGNIKSESDYYPSGGELPFISNDPNNYKFGGNERDVESGLDHIGVRYYSNSLSRFTTPDPLMIQKQKLADPQQWNMYQYARNNPLRFNDPTGKYVCEGNKTNCTTIHEALDLAKTAAANLKEGSKERKALEKTIKFYGDEGKKNGVVVKFGDLPKGYAGAAVTNGKTTTVTLDMKQILQGAQQAGLTGPQTAEAYVEQTVHEGTHGVDQRVHGMPQNKADETRQERSAFTAQSGVPMGLNMTSAYGLWDPSWDPATADALRQNAIEQNVNTATQLWCANGGNCK